ncbi:perlucin-like protein isoform X2 [Saccostrea cucullata]|uniref:perlucin-like protein isoform X2 n=1 Tax=Saccostrea cuccullata TaxID=36930 RepID=UPI002ED2B4CF
MLFTKMDLIRNCIAGALIAFVFGAAYVFEARLNGVIKEVNKQNKELLSLKLNHQTKVEKLEKITEANAKELETQKAEFRNHIKTLEKSIDEIKEKKQKTAKSGCPDGWLSFKSSCYVLIHQKKHWAAAQDFCLGQNGYLANIGDASENQFLREQLQLHGNQEDFWVGATDAMVEGDWRWLPKLDYVVFSDWARGEPNNQGDQDCVDLEYGRQYQWDDDRCNNFRSFICERGQLE